MRGSELDDSKREREQLALRAAAVGAHRILKRAEDGLEQSLREEGGGDGEEGREGMAESLAGSGAGGRRIKLMMEVDLS